MPQHEQATRTLVVHGRPTALRQEESVVRAVPVWASPPDVPLLVMLGESSPEAPAALRVIRHRLEQRRAEGMWTVGVTSARDGEGKSTLAAQLALVLSEAQRARVLLVEAAMHRPSLARVLGVQVPPGVGFSVQLLRRLRAANGHEAEPPWTVLALGPALHALLESEAEPGFPQVLHSTHFRRAIARLEHVYDWVVVDGPSILDSGDASVVEEAVDGVVLVAKSGASRGADLRSALKQLGDRKAVGVVLWDAR
jgi:Mrp family chromosome partitioning ATPase